MGKPKPKSASADAQMIANPDRSIRVFGEITPEMVAELTPQILAFKQASADPITVYIDSPGGIVDGATALSGLLKSPDQKGRKSWINAVVTGKAASAAAYLLAVADYAIAYEHSQIYFHGIYRGSEEDVTVEKASDLWQSLSFLNSSASTTLAQVAFGRFLHVYSRVDDELRALRKAFQKQLARDYESLPSEPLDIAAFAVTLAQYVTASAAGLVLHSLDEVARFWNALNISAEVDSTFLEHTGLKSVRASRPESSASELNRQFGILLAVCIQRLQANPEWDVASEDFLMLKRDFDFVSLASSPVFQTDLLRTLADYQTLFMSGKDLSYFGKFNPDDLDDNLKLRERYDRAVSDAYEAVKPLWFFIVTLFRRLYSGENPIIPEDAWWLGLVDEVIGTTLIRRNVSPQYHKFLQQIVG